MERIPLSGIDPLYDEAFIQDLAFAHPTCLPVSEIDSAYEDLVPICCELNTPVGPLDILYVTPKGRVVVVEAKLWRNPEARRKVIGQILDYANELSRWNYEDLQREVSRITGKKGNALYEIVKQKHTDLDEANFVDEVTRSLKYGRFLLLLLGDGIREGVGSIAEYLGNTGNLGFTLGLVELALHRAPNNGIMVQPRVLAKTVIVQRSVITLKDQQLIIEDSAEEKEEISKPSELDKFYAGFWPEFMDRLELDDPAQPLPKSFGKTGNVFFPMTTPQAWITVYFFQSRNNVGVFLTFNRGNYGDLVYAKLLEKKVQIESELEIPVEWESDGSKHMIISYRHYSDVRNVENREEIKSFLADSINRFVNVFRHRLEKITSEL